MELEHSFTVPVPKSRAWDVLLDVERVAPCMPGASLDSVDGDEIHGRIKVKVGPINMTYAGTARFVERDKDAGIVTLEASGKETRGAGTASASVRSVLEDRGQETHVKVLTTLNVTGKPAQFGRGVMNEVGGRLLTIFASNLAALIAEPEGAAADGQAAAAGAAAAEPAGTPSAEPAGLESAGPDGTAAPAAEAPIDDLKLQARATSSLRREGITTIGQLATKTEDELLAIDGIGPASVEEIKAKLTDLGLTPGQPLPASAGAAVAPTPVAATAVVAPQATDGATASAASAAAPVAPHTSTARERVNKAEDDAINLLRVAGLPVLKRAIPVLAGLAAALLIALRRKSARRRGR
jgi:carbon monoxide dehydrogenase subunit G/predicted flap endonuclease-1-like 5' DNA nuclease